jgi:hypothetical protein
MAEAVELKIQYVLKRKRHDGVLIENEIATIIYVLGRVPSVKAERARGSPVEAETDDLRIVKTGNASEPRDQIEATWDAGVDCLDFVHVRQESSAVRLVK